MTTLSAGIPGANVVDSLGMFAATAALPEQMTVAAEAARGLKGLPDHDPRRFHFLMAADAHRDAGIAAVTAEHYAGSHWLGTFAVYLETMDLEDRPTGLRRVR